MIFKDDRTEAEKTTHTWLITATDKFMSGWGNARGGKSKVAWACRPEHACALLDWVDSREEMSFVNATLATNWRPRNCVHMHVYVANANHPAVEDGEC